MNDETTEPKPKVPFHVQVAKASWMAPLVGIVIFNVVGRSAESREVSFAITCIASVTYVVGLVFAVWAIVGAFRKGPLRILIPASIGLLINGFIIFAFIGTLAVTRQQADARRLESEQDSSQASDERWGGLKTHVHGTPVALADLAVVLLHGYGASGSDLVALGDVIDAPPKTAFLFPEGPISLEQGGRAWYRPSGARFGETRHQICQFIANITRTSPDCDIVIGGFSQGAILASNLLTEAENSRLKGVILYSPAFDLSHPPSDNQPLPHVLIAHGRSDRVLSFSESEKLRAELQAFGCEITWVPFEGGHTISPSVIEATSKFLATLKKTSVPLAGE
jgi:phospholipase/carboxylesterase